MCIPQCDVKNATLVDERRFIIGDCVSPLPTRMAYGYANVFIVKR